jgi:hypothetical protein
MNTRLSVILSAIASILILAVGPAFAQNGLPQAPQAVIGSAFTYQGQLVKNGSPYAGTCDLTFGLFDSATGGLPVGSSYTLPSVLISGGIFTVKLNDAAQFGANPFDGSPRYLEIAVKCPGDSSPVTLGRQELTATPYASYALTAGSVTNGVVTTGSYSDPGWLTSLSAGKISGVLPVANGGTGSSTQNFVDLSSGQNISGTKTFTSPPAFVNGAFLHPAAPFSVSLFAIQKVSNLNADMLDGAHAGNAAGNVPLNNSTLNTGLNADMLDGAHASQLGAHYQNRIVVAKSGGDFTIIQAALDSIPTSGAGAPSDTNHYLVFVAPGIYNEEVIMRDYVDIAGAGEQVTKITFNGANAPYRNATIIASNYAELRNLTVVNTGGHGDALGIYIQKIYFYLTHVSLYVSGSTSGENIGIDFVNGSYAFLAEDYVYVIGDLSTTSNSTGILTDLNANILDLRQVTIYTLTSTTGECAAIKILGGTLTLSDSHIQGDGGAYVEGVVARTVVSIPIYVHIDRSTISVAHGTYQYPIELEGSTVAGRVGVSYVGSGGVWVHDGATLTCVGDYNVNYAPLNASCQ